MTPTSAGISSISSFGRNSNCSSVSCAPPHPPYESSSDVTLATALHPGHSNQEDYQEGSQGDAQHQATATHSHLSEGATNLSLWFDRRRSPWLNRAPTLRIASSSMDLWTQSESLEVMIGVGRQHRARSDLLATRTKRIRSLCKIWHGDTPDDYERAAADFEAVDGTALAFDSLCKGKFNEQQGIRCHISQVHEYTRVVLGRTTQQRPGLHQVTHVGANIARRSDMSSCDSRTSLST
jgi:hypothetical protein